MNQSSAEEDLEAFEETMGTPWGYLAIVYGILYFALSVYATWLLLSAIWNAYA